jgi:hypothetical protein
MFEFENLKLYDFFICVLQIVLMELFQTYLLVHICMVNLPLGN